MVINVNLDFINKVLTYNQETGVFTWNVRVAQRIKIGVMAGSVSKSKNYTGYLKIKVLGKSYLAHRLAWLITYGKFPQKMIDHIDGNKLNNSIKNLREVTRKENMQNTKLRKDNTSGFNGVYFNSQRKKWVAYVTEDKKMKYLGIFKKKEDAISKRIEADELIGFHKNHGKRC
jgi:hypothetical protein